MFSTLDFQVQNVNRQLPNLVLCQQLVELTEVAEHQPDRLYAHAQVHTALPIIAQDPRQGRQQGCMRQQGFQMLGLSEECGDAVGCPSFVLHVFFVQVLLQIMQSMQTLNRKPSSWYSTHPRSPPQCLHCQHNTHHALHPWQCYLMVL